MRTIPEHLAAALTLVEATPAVEVPLALARGLVLAAAVHSADALPRWDNSAMDGFAVRAVDLAVASAAAPVPLPLAGELPAGAEAAVELAAGTCVAIMTGSPVPPGADAVVPVELVERAPGAITFHEQPEPGAHIRRAGEDLAAGDLVLSQGAVLGPTQLAAIASAGHGSVSAHRTPRVAVLATGDELVAPGEPLRRGQIPDSNSFLLAACVEAAGCEAVRLDRVADRPDALRGVLVRAEAAGVDAVVTTGGVSMGDYDVVKELLSGTGVEFVKVAMQPGKPQGIGRLAGGTPFFGLPGNPVSVFVSFEMFVRPALQRLRGLVEVERPTFDAEVIDGWRTPHGRTQVMPVAFADGGTRVRRATRGGSGSHLVASLALAEGLAVVPAEIEHVRPGDRVQVMRVDR
ncbi:MAG: molybdopterin molybdotransferase MoeA [Actinomycetales bacterium]|nr:molybdopterin molybdotransferase MoeA [Actinomycetales bacterium]